MQINRCKNCTRRLLDEADRCPKCDRTIPGGLLTLEAKFYCATFVSGAVALIFYFVNPFQ